MEAQIQIDDINRKLDVILEEIELQRRHRREMEDFKDDLLRVGRDVYQTAVDELDEIHDDVKNGEIIHLGKKMLRNVNNLTKTFEQLENLKDFMTDFGPASRQLALDLMEKLDKLDRMGYFEFMKELKRILDNIVSSYTVEDVKKLGENIITILDTIKNLTQPEMLTALNNAVNVYKGLDLKSSEKVSYRTLLKEMNSPEVRKGLILALRFLKNLSNGSVVIPA